jgi:hypothetical protein
MLFTMSVSIFAEDNNVTEVEKYEKYDFNVNTRKLANYLGLSSDQMESVEEISNEFERDMKFAYYENTNESRKRIVKNAVEKNINYMAYVLTHEQYRNYLKVLNVTLVNRGFKF